MLSSPNAVASHRGAVALFESGRRTPAGHPSLHTPLVGGGVPAAMGAGETQSVISASPAPVLITEQQVMFATAAGTAWRSAAIRRPLDRPALATAAAAPQYPAPTAPQLSATAR